MSCCIQPIEGCVWAGSPPVLLGRIYGNAGTAITQASISSINRRVVNKDTGVQISSTALVVADVVFNTLQTDARWTLDGIGYNFADQPAAGDFGDADTVIQVQYTFTPASGEVFKSDPFDITVKGQA